MTCIAIQNAVGFTAMKHLNPAYISASHGGLRGRAAVVNAAIIFLLVFVGGANACHHNAETAEQTSTEAPQKADEKAECEARADAILGV